MFDGLPTLQDIDVTGKRVLLRVAYDLPKQIVDGRTEIADDTRIRVTLPTIERLLKAGCSVVICGGWWGRPTGVDPALRMDPVAARLSELLNRPVQKLDDCVGPAVDQAISRMQSGELILLENTRFHPEEQANDPEFVRQLASLGELCVFDAFAQAHRDHASTTGLVRALPTVLGPQIIAELTALSRVTTNPDRPFVVVMGGAKITDKIVLLRRLVDQADHLLVGGALANTFLKASGATVGTSLVETMDVDGTGTDPLALAREIFERAGDKLLLPTDVVVGDDPRAPIDVRELTLGPTAVPADRGIYDIGPASVARYAAVIRDAKTVFWNGTLGVNTTEQFAAGSRGVATVIAANQSAVTIVGGGDTAEAVHDFGLVDRFTHVSTGGGASLKVVSGQELAVIAAMKKDLPPACRQAGPGRQGGTKVSP